MLEHCYLTGLYNGYVNDYIDMEGRLMKVFHNVVYCVLYNFITTVKSPLMKKYFIF